MAKNATAYFPVLHVDGEPIHEALAIGEWTAEHYPEANLWARDAMSRARPRALFAEMASNVIHPRHHMSCHVFARVPAFVPNGPTRVEIARVFELMQISSCSSWLSARNSRIRGASTVGWPRSSAITASSPPPGRPSCSSIRGCAPPSANIATSRRSRVMR